MGLKERLIKIEDVLIEDDREVESGEVAAEADERKLTECAIKERAWWNAFFDAAEEIEQTMSDKHAALVFAELETELEKRSLGLSHERSLLFDRFHWMTTRKMKGERRTWALPPVVAEVLINDERARSIHECEDCGLWLPYAGEISGASVAEPLPARAYFERCPLCGGRVGEHFYYFKHGRT